MTDVSNAGSTSRKASIPRKHFQRKQRAAQRHAVGSGHAGARAASDQQPALFVGQTGFVRQDIGDHRAGLFWRTFAAERSAHSDDDDRQHRAAQCPHAGKRPAENQIASVMSMLLLLVRRTRRSGPRPSPHPPLTALGCAATALPGGGVEQCRAGAWPHEMLHGLQDQRQRGGGCAGAKTGKHDRQPKAPAGIRTELRCRARWESSSPTSLQGPSTKSAPLCNHDAAAITTAWARTRVRRQTARKSRQRVMHAAGLASSASVSRFRAARRRSERRRRSEPSSGRCSCCRPAPS